MKDSEIEERLEKLAQQIGGMYGMLMHMDEVLEKVHLTCNMMSILLGVLIGTVIGRLFF